MFISKCLFLKHFILFSKQLLFLNLEYFFLEHLHLFWEHFILLCSIILFHFVLRTFHFCSRNNLHFFSVSFVQNNFSMEYFYMFQNNFKIQQYFCIRIGIHIWKLFVVVACATVLSCDMWVPVATATIYRARLRLISSYKVFQALLPGYSVRWGPSSGWPILSMSTFSLWWLFSIPPPSILEHYEMFQTFSNG